MHELSIAQGILEIVKNALPAGEAQYVKAVKVKVGRMSGVVSDSLQFCLEAIVNGTPLQRATLQIESIPFILDCKVCNNRFESEFGFVVCPSCGEANDGWHARPHPDTVQECTYCDTKFKVSADAELRIDQ